MQPVQKVNMPSQKLDSLVEPQQPGAAAHEESDCLQKGMAFEKQPPAG